MTPSSVIVLSADEIRRRPYRLAWRDLVSGASQVQLWGSMGVFDIRQRYARSTLGPFWLTISLGFYMGTIAVVSGSLFKTSLSSTLAYLSIGMTIWTFCLSMMIDGTKVFVSAELAIKQMPAPLSVHAFRLVWTTLILLAHNALVPLLVLGWASPLQSLSGLPASLLGLAIVIVNSFAAALTLGTLGARFRDLQLLLTSVTSLLFFVTPIFWRADQLGDRVWIALVNPFYHFMEIVRAPLLGEPVAAVTWGCAIGFTALNLLVAFLVFGRFRARIPYWV